MWSVSMLPDFEAEIETLNENIDKLLDSSPTHAKQVVFLVGSKATILALGSVEINESEKVEYVKYNSKQLLIFKWVISFQMIPSHSGIYESYALAKRGCKLS